MNHVPQRQLSCAIRAGGGKCSAALVKKLDQRYRAVVSTQVIEDFNNCQRNSRQLKGSKKYRRPAVSWATVIKSKVLTKRQVSPPATPWPCRN